MVAILLIAVALRLWQLGTQSLWHDEAWSIFSAYHPLAWGAQGTDPNAPALFYLSLGVWMQLAGDGVWLLRFWSLLWGLVTVALAGSIARTWFNARVGLLAAFLVAASPILWVFSQEIRAYVVMPTAALLLLFLLDRLLRHPSRQLWIWLALVELLALYTHNLAVPLIAWLNVTAAFAWLIRRDGRRFGLWLTVQTILGVAYLPWLATQRPTGTPLNTPPPIRPGVVWDIWQAYFTGIKPLVGADPTLMRLTAFFGAIALVALITGLMRRRSARFYLLLSQAILVPIFELAIIWAAHIDFHPRYFIVGVPAALIVIAVGADAVRGAGQVRHEARPRLIMGAVATFAALIMFDMAHTTFSSAIYQHDDFRAIADYYATLPPTAAIVIPYNWEPTLAYYAPKVGIRAQIIGIPLGSDWQTITDRLNKLAADQVELLTWYQLPADVRGAYSCLLGAVSENPPHTLTVNGLTTSGYLRPDRIDPRPVAAPLPPPFVPFESRGTWIVANDRRLCVLSDWTTRGDSKALRDPARVTVGLIDPLGDIVAHNDADLRDDHQTPTQFWPIGTAGTAFTLIQKPVGASGVFPLRASVYTVDLAGTAHGLDVIQNGAPIGQSALLGEATLPPVNPDPVELAAIAFQPVAPGYAAALIDGLPKADPSQCAVQPGDSLHLSVLWRYAAPGSRAIADQARKVGLRVQGSDWMIAQTAPIDTSSRVTRQWFTINIPKTASGSFTVEALINDGTFKPIGACTVVAAEHRFNPPTIAQPLDIHFPGVGQLIGYAVGTIDPVHRTPFTLTLDWQAEGAAATSYTVFTHLLDRDGHVIAQNDSPPLNGERSTTGWQRGEYLIDPHTLTFNSVGTPYSGAVTLEVGLYDPVSGKRVLLSNGDDHTVLPLSGLAISVTTTP